MKVGIVGQDRKDTILRRMDDEFQFNDIFIIFNIGPGIFNFGCLCIYIHQAGNQQNQVFQIKTRAAFSGIYPILPQPLQSGRVPFALVVLFVAGW